MKAKSSPLSDRESPAWSNLNSLWGAFAAEILERYGVAGVVISPGSRSTPLTYGVAMHPGLRSFAVLDERSAAFVALGWAKRSGKPVALICTSGTAVANYFPAVIEASESGVPLLILTADRPPEHRHCRIGQTIDQLKIFGQYPRFQAEVPLPEESVDVWRRFRDLLSDAIALSGGVDAGPVHLNMPFREPLAPARKSCLDWDLEPLQLLRSVQPCPVMKPKLENKITIAGKRGLILAGAAQPSDCGVYLEALRAIAKRSGWPVLADVSSPARTASMVDAGVVAGYDWLLRNEDFRRTQLVDTVLCLGELPTSKVLRQWLAEVQPQAFVIDPRNRANNPSGLASTRIRADLEAVAEDLIFAEQADSSWLNSWIEAEQRVQQKLDAACAEVLHEGSVSRDLGRHMPEGLSVMIASSLPIRDAEWFWPADIESRIVQVNRGANGIDGTLSSAIGMAIGAGGRGVLITGDLAFLHDANGMAAVRHAGVQLDVVLINNAGGGIFNHLPIAAMEPPFEDYFGTPQAVKMDQLVVAWGGKHIAVKTLKDLAAVGRFGTEPEIRVFEVCTRRTEETEWRRGLFSTVPG